MRLLSEVIVHVILGFDHWVKPKWTWGLDRVPDQCGSNLGEWWREYVEWQQDVVKTRSIHQTIHGKLSLIKVVRVKNF